MSSASVSGKTKAAKSNPTTIPKDTPTPTVPKLHYGICEEHGTFKVHHCLTHNIFICSDCVVAYHLEADCHRVSIGKILNDRKADLYKKIHSRMSSLQDKSREVEVQDAIGKETEFQIKTQIEKLQADIKLLTQQMSICHNSSSIYTGIIKECKDRQKQVQVLINDVQKVTTFPELMNETKLNESSDHEIQEWTKQVEDTLKQQGFGGSLTSGSFTSLVSFKETYVTHTHEGTQRWARMLSRDGRLFMQDFRINKAPTGAFIFNLSDMFQNLATPRHVYLTFSTINGMPLGTVIIKLNEKVPRRARQLIWLCLGQRGLRFPGTIAIRVANKGQSKQSFYIHNYLSSNDEKSNEKLISDLERGDTAKHKLGLVCNNEDSAGIHIFTRSDYMATYQCPALGEAVSGLPELEKIIGDNLISELDSSKSQIIISESGLVINSSC